MFIATSRQFPVPFFGFPPGGNLPDTIKETTVYRDDQGLITKTTSVERTLPYQGQASQQSQQTIVRGADGWSRFAGGPAGLSWGTVEEKPDDKPDDKRSGWLPGERERLRARIQQFKNRQEDEQRRKLHARLKREIAADRLRKDRELLEQLRERLKLPPRPRYSQQEQNTAIHEAGHAFVCAWHEVPIVHASIVLKDDMAGHVRATFYEHKPHVQCLVAGSVAESISSSGTGQHWKPSHIGDLMRLEEIGADEAEIASAIQHVDRLLRQHWPIIREISDLLLERRHVPGEDIETLVQRRLQHSQAA